MKSVLLKICCLGAVLLAISGCQKISSDDGVYRVRIPLDNGQGHYVLQTKELRTVTDLSAMSGSTAVFRSDGRFDINLESDGKAEVASSTYGNTPTAHFIKSSGVYIPADYVSLSMTAAMYHFEAIRNFYDGFGANKDLTFPRTVLINVVEAYRRGDEQMVSSNNAAYVPSLDVFFINPYKRPDIPLPLNGGVLAHEYLHSVFAKKFNMAAMKLMERGLISREKFDSLAKILVAVRLDEWKTATAFDGQRFAQIFSRDRRHHDEQQPDGSGERSDSHGRNGHSRNDGGNSSNGGGSGTGGTGHNGEGHSGGGTTSPSGEHDGPGSDTGESNPDSDSSGGDHHSRPEIPPADPDSGETIHHPAPPPDDVSMSTSEIRAANDLIFGAINEGVADYYGYEYTQNPGWIVPSLPSQTFRDLSQEKTFTLSSLEQKRIIQRSINSRDPESRIDEHGLGAYFSHFLYVVSSSEGGWGSEKTERKTLDFLDRYASLFAQVRDSRFISLGDLVRLYFADETVPGSICGKIVAMFPAELGYGGFSCGAIVRSELK